MTWNTIFMISSYGSGMETGEHDPHKKKKYADHSSLHKTFSPKVTVTNDIYHSPIPISSSYLIYTTYPTHLSTFPPHFFPKHVYTSVKWNTIFMISSYKPEVETGEHSPPYSSYNDKS